MATTVDWEIFGPFLIESVNIPFIFYPASKRYFCYRKRIRFCRGLKHGYLEFFPRDEFFGKQRLLMGFTHSFRDFNKLLIRRSDGFVCNTDAAMFKGGFYNNREFTR